MVGKLLTDFFIGQLFSHQWGNSWPIKESVNNFPTKEIFGSTSGEIVDRFENRSSFSPPSEAQVLDPDRVKLVRVKIWENKDINFKNIRASVDILMDLI